MLLSIVGTTPASSPPSPLHSTSSSNPHLHACRSLLPKSLFPGFEAARAGFLERLLHPRGKNLRCAGAKRPALVTRAVNASLIEAPLLWAGRLCIFYALLKAGLAGSEANPLVSELESDGGVGGESGDLGFSEWLGSLQKKPDYAPSWN